MIIGIGIDTTDIREMKRLVQEVGAPFVEKTFSKYEIAASQNAPDRWEYLASRFAVKEAVFKALAHAARNRTFDFRIVETCNQEDGAPYIYLSSELRQLMCEAGVTKFHISITHENEYASAFVIAESTKERM